jgi:hypothetical protein
MHLNQPPRRFSEHDASIDVPIALENVVLKCMAKSADDRFQSMREVEAALAAIARGEDVEIDVPISVAPPAGELELLPIPSSPGVPASGERVSGASAAFGVPSSERPGLPADSMRTSFVGDVRASSPNIIVPPSMRSHDPVEAELRAAAEVAEAEREWAASGGRSRRWPVLLGAVLVLAALGGGWFLLAMQGVEPMGEAFQASRPLIFGQYLEGVDRHNTVTKKVALVLSPIDAHVYVGEKDLGKMPVEVEVPENGTVDVEVKRDGYWTKKQTLNDDRDSVTVRLAPIIAGGRRATPKPLAATAGAVPAAPPAMKSPPAPEPAPSKPAPAE